MDELQILINSKVKKKQIEKNQFDLSKLDIVSRAYK